MEFVQIAALCCRRAESISAGAGRNIVGRASAALILVLLPIIGYAQSCAVAPAPMQPTLSYRCVDALCSNFNSPNTIQCPNGSIGALQACSVANFYAGNVHIYGPLTFDHYHASGNSINLFFNSLSNGEYTAGIAGVGPSQPCPQFWVVAPPPPKSQTCSANCVGDPINPANGNVYLQETDVQLAGAATALTFKRFYNSADPDGIDGVPGWRHSYGRSVKVINQYPSIEYLGGSATESPQYSTPDQACSSGFLAIQASVSAWASASASYSNGICVLSNGATVIGTLPIQAYPVPTPSPSPIEYDAIRDDGQVVRFTTQGAAINNQPGESLRLAIAGSGFTVTDDQDNVEVYNSAGVLQSITGRNLVVQTVSYDGTGNFNGVTDSFGNALLATRNPQGGLASISVNGGATVLYSYDAAQRLVKVTNLDTTTEQYVYGDARFTNALTAKVDESGTTYASWTYDAQERAISDELAGGVSTQNLIYNADGSVTATDALGAVRTFSYLRVGDINAVAGISGSQCPTCQEAAATTYDSAGFVSSRTDYNGNVTCYANDPVRGVGVVQVEGFAPGSTCPSNLSSYSPASGTLQRKITTQWDSTWTEPSVITEPTRTTSLAFDANGNVLTKTVTDTSNSPNVARTWTYTYNGFGQVLTVDGPRTDVADVTTYTYYTCTTGYQCGQVDTATDALGHVTTFNTYNAFGQPLTITDPNGVLTTLSYDAQMRLVSRQVSTETTTFSYWPTGLLKTITLPDSSDLQYTYDTAHRLTQVQDGAGNRISYTLDGLGNWTVQSRYDPSNTLTRTQSRVFNSLSELYQTIGSAGTSAVTTTFGYDSNGNQTSISAPLSRNATNVFDALNRLSQVTDPNGGVAHYSYDVNDHVASVIDPRSLSTSYTYNGFGQLISQLSPDSGTTTQTYDMGGNVSSRTDARGDSGTYSYDALNRITGITYPDQAIVFAYDAGTNGIGHRTSASDANHSMAWTYDPLGRVTQKTQTIGTIAHSVSYAYTNGDLTSITTPSGQMVTFSYSNGRMASVSVNGTALLTNVTYDPFGPVSGWTWGNGTTTLRAYNSDGNVSQISTGGEVTSYSYDNAQRVSSIANLTNSALSWSLGYDPLDRLTSANKATFAESWTYDADGNRLSQGGTDATTFTVSPTSNQTTAASGWANVSGVGYDAAGNETGTVYGSTTYNDAGRPAFLSGMTPAGSITGQLVYNALGQRIRKSVSGALSDNVDFVYDEQGHLLGEYDPSGNLVEETVWMGDTPVATIRPNGGSSVAVYYVHTDHLNTPTKISQPSTNLLAWRWDGDPFGLDDPNNNTGENQNPSGLGPFYYNLRFPGQYADMETGSNYNMARDYAPLLGAYVQSDPIGLAGGSYSTYAYADGTPISEIDPFGLWGFGDSLPQSVVDVAAGFGDTLSWGVTNWVRNQEGWNGVVNRCSSAYEGGTYAGTAVGAAFAVDGIAAGGLRAEIGNWKTEGDWFFPEGTSGPHFHWGEGPGLQTHHLPWQLDNWLNNLRGLASRGQANADIANIAQVAYGTGTVASGAVQRCGCDK